MRPVIDNSSLLRECATHRFVHVTASDILRQVPQRLPTDFDFQKVEGMLLGLAVGDALGEPTESMLPNERRGLVGEQRDYINSQRQELGSIGAGTDDTQLAFWTVEQLLADGGLVPERLMQRFGSAHIVGIGAAVKESHPPIQVRWPPMADVWSRVPWKRSVDAHRSHATPVPAEPQCLHVRRCCTEHDAHAQ